MKIPFGKNRTLYIAELGTCGIRLSEHWYADVFLRPCRRLGLFINDGIFRRWYTLTWRGWVIDKLEVLDANNAARVFRRTIKPYTLIRHNRGHVMEAMSYPIPNSDNTVSIMARCIPEDSTSLDEFDVTEFMDELSLQPTDIPAENPVPRNSTIRSAR